MLRTVAREYMGKHQCALRVDVVPVYGVEVADPHILSSFYQQGILCTYYAKKDNEQADKEDRAAVSHSDRN